MKLTATTEYRMFCADCKTWYEDPGNGALTPHDTCSVEYRG